MKAVRGFDHVGLETNTLVSGLTITLESALIATTFNATIGIVRVDVLPFINKNLNNFDLMLEQAQALTETFMGQSGRVLYLLLKRSVHVYLIST